MSSTIRVTYVRLTGGPADPLWPRVVQGRCTWCGDLKSEHEGGIREHHRTEVVGGRYDDEPEILPGLPALVDSASPGVTDASLVAVSMPAEAARWLSRHLHNTHHELRGRDAEPALTVQYAANDGMICDEPPGITPEHLAEIRRVAGGVRGALLSYVDDAAPGVAPVDPESPGVSAVDLARVIADRLHGLVTPTPSGWVKLAGAAIGGQLVLTVTTWGPLSAGMPALNRTVLLGEVEASASPGARPDTAER